MGKTRALFKQMNYFIDTKRARLAVATRIRPDSRFTPNNGRGPTGGQFKIDDLFFYWHLGYVFRTRGCGRRPGLTDMPGNCHPTGMKRSG